MTRRTKLIVRISVVILGVTALGTTLWIRSFKQYTPAEIMQDLRAGVAARNDPKPVERFLELRYGPLTEATNRQKAFIDFFNVGHIQGMHLMVSRMPESKRQANINAMAQWIEGYRRSLSSEEKQDLSDYLRSDAGHATLQHATAQYLSHDVRYRSATAPVIAELMATLAEVQKQ